MANYVRGELTVFPRAVSVTGVDVEYCLGMSNTIAPNPDPTDPNVPQWQTTVPAIQTSYPYIWTRTKTVQSNSTQPIYSAAMCITQDQGDGIYVTDIEEQYYLSTSMSTQTGGSWSTSPPTWENGKYIWTRSALTYSDSTQATPHIVTTDPVLATYLNLSESTREELNTTETALTSVQTIANNSINRLNNIEAQIQIGVNEIGFYDKNRNKVAWINGNEFHFTQGLVEFSLQVGNYLIKDDGSGGFAIV